MRLLKAILTLVVVGIFGAAVLLGSGASRRGAAQAQPARSTPAAEQMIEAARAVLAGLAPELRAKASFAFDDPARLAWHYYPITPEPRKGAVLKAMNIKEKELVKALLRAGTSQPGYETGLNVIALDGILRDIENTDWAKKYRDPDLYYLCIFGTPAAKGKWGWRIEGHHLSINYVLEDGRITSTTPSAFGANPAVVPSGPFAGLRTLGREEDLARQLYVSLEHKARRKATISEQAPFDVLTEVKPQPKRLPAEGLPAGEMNDAQKELLRQLLVLYAGKHPAEAADRFLKEVQDAGFDQVHFAWAGLPEPAQPHYYRIQGPTFVIEFCNSQNRANHVHAVWRSYQGDFGVPAGSR